MPSTDSSPLHYYASQGPITEPGAYSHLLEGLPTGIPALCKVVQGLIIHYDTLRLYGATSAPDRLWEGDSRDVPRLLARIQELDGRPLIEPRPPDKRLIGCCRDFATLLVAILRHQGTPARARYGFALYFDGQGAAFNPDHIVCEYWHEEEDRWVMVDPQQDELLARANNLSFDPCDVPRDQFPLAGEIWQLGRAGQIDPGLYGTISDGPEGVRGMSFIQQQLVQDLAALNKMEMLCWDSWGLIQKLYADTLEEERSLLDRVAALTLGGDGDFGRLRRTYDMDGLRVPGQVRCYTMGSKWKKAEIVTVGSAAQCKVDG